MNVLSRYCYITISPYYDVMWSLSILYIHKTITNVSYYIDIMSMSTYILNTIMMIQIDYINLLQSN